MTRAGRFVVCGASGHAEVVIATIEAAGGEVVRVLDDNESLYRTPIQSHLVERPISSELVPPRALAIPGVRIGAWSTVGAGGVVIHAILRGQTAAGVPARAFGREHS